MRPVIAASRPSPAQLRIVLKAAAHSVKRTALMVH
jgi:hypothetical protein